MRQLALLLLLAALTSSVLFAQTPQPPWKGENLQYFPKDITRQQLTQRMREFSFSLGVRCQYCHPGGNGISFDGVVFSSDEKPAKVKARVKCPEPSPAYGVTGGGGGGAAAGADTSTPLTPEPVTLLGPREM